MHCDKKSEEPLPGKDCSWSDKTAALESGDNDGNDIHGGARHSDYFHAHQYLDCVKSQALVIGFSGM